MITGSFVELACTSKACAPPPVGVGGSKPSGSAPRLKPAGGGEASTTTEAFTQSDDAIRSLSETDAGHAIRLYVEAYTQEAYAVINEGLRRYGKPTSANATAVKMMDTAFNKASVRLTEPATVHRGMVVEADESAFDLEASMFRKGKVVTDKAYVSTSIEPGTAEAFTRTGMDPGYEGLVPVYVTVHLPKGTRVLAGSWNEHELILDRGRKMRITDTSVNEDGVLEVEMQVLP